MLPQTERDRPWQEFGGLSTHTESPRPWQETSSGPSSKGRTIWTDGSRLDNGRVGVAAVWWRDSYTPPPRTGPHPEATCHPVREEADWVGRRFHLGDNKAVFDAEIYAIHQTLRHFDTRNENTAYTVFSDSTAALSRAPGG